MPGQNDGRNGPNARRDDGYAADGDDAQHGYGDGRDARPASSPTSSSSPGGPSCSSSASGKPDPATHRVGHSTAEEGGLHGSVPGQRQGQDWLPGGSASPQHPPADWPGPANTG